MTEEFLERWLEGVLAAPGLTGLRQPAEARRVLLDDALRVRPLIERTRGAIVDVGFGWRLSGHSPRSGAPRPLVHASRGGAAQVRLSSRDRSGAPERRGRVGACRGAADGSVRGRPRQGTRETAHCRGALPPARRGGRRRDPLGWRDSGRRPRGLWSPQRLAAELEDDEHGFLVLRKTGPTPPGFPRRAGMAKKRPLA